MKVTLTPDPVFTVNLGSLQLGAMRQVDRWEGLIKLQGEHGTLILHDGRMEIERGLEYAFDKKPDLFIVVKASPEIVTMLRNATAAGQVVNAGEIDS